MGKIVKRHETEFTPTQDEAVVVLNIPVRIQDLAAGACALVRPECGDVCDVWASTSSDGPANQITIMCKQDCENYGIQDRVAETLETAFSGALAAPNRLAAAEHVAFLLPREG